MSIDASRGTGGLDTARAVADALLYEGYLLYPYRASSSKNRNSTVRWQFGVVGPQDAYDAGAGEDPSMQTECLLVPGRPGTSSRFDLRLRFLQLQTRNVERLEGDRFVAVEELRAGDATWLSWDEAVDGHVDVTDVDVVELLTKPRIIAVDVPGGEDVEVLTDVAGSTVGRLRRSRWPVLGSLRVTCTPVDGAPDGCVAVRVRLDNTGGWVGGGDRDQSLRQSFLGAHFVLTVRDGEFLSLLEPPQWAAAAAVARENHRCWPVLVGDGGAHGTSVSDTVLASPIILYDWPAIAADSAGDLFDSTEIDEILTLRVMTMTDEEKRQARATDPRAGAIVDRCDAMTAESLERLHGGRARDSTDEQRPGGEVPWWDPATDASFSPTTDTVDVSGVPVTKGSRVRLHPSRRADAQDIFFAGEAATVAGVYNDVDGNVHVAVVLENDPAADLHEWYGRFLYFDPEEIEPLEAAP